MAIWSKVQQRVGSGRVQKQDGSQPKEQRRAGSKQKQNTPQRAAKPEPPRQFAEQAEQIKRRVGIPTEPAPPKIRGVNLSGWFILEPWITPSLYAATGASNDHELQLALGPAAYNERLRQHMETFIGEDDFRRIAAMGLNAVRIPVPWHAFGVQQDEVAYIPCIDYLDRAFEWSEKYQLRVLLDLATVPGGQGDSNDSPTTPETPADWHSSTDGRAVALDVLERLAKRYGAREGLLGIELLDTPIMSVRRGIAGQTEGIPGHYLRNFYRDAYRLLRAHLPEEKIIVFSASGQPKAWRHFMNRRDYRNVYMDVHLYHYQGEHAQDLASPSGLSKAVERNRKMLAAAHDAGFPVIVGEWSAAAVVSDASVTPEGRRAYERVFVSNQLSTFDKAEGWFFQTWKTERRIEAWDARVVLAPLERKMME